jgi:NAD(P)H-flavin reductase
MSEESFDLNEKRSSSDSFAALLEGSQTTTMSILIKGKDGFTKKLLQKAEDSPEGRIKAMALAEGPFGGIHSLSSYGTLLLVAGGIGITHPMSYLHEVVTNFSSKNSATRKVHLVWMIRSLGKISSLQLSPCIANPDFRSSGMDTHMDARCLEPRRPQQHH